jgi:hypothetical protein
MGNVFDLYGLLEKDIDAAMRSLSQALKLPFAPHESASWGDYYLSHSADWREQIRIRENFNPEENTWDKPEFQKYALLLEVSVTLLARAREIETGILKTKGPGAVLLKRKEYPPEKHSK